LVLPLDVSGTVIESVQVWELEGGALHCGAEADAWVSAVLNNGKSKIKSYRLLRFVESQPRLIKNHPTFPGGENDFAAFQDYSPFLVVNQQSLNDLNSRLMNPIPINRFRPNIVVDGDTAWEEDCWGEIEVNGVVLVQLRRCGRCSVPTRDQSNGISSEDYEPIATMRTFRLGTSLYNDERYDSDTTFGISMAYQQNQQLSGKTISKNDNVTILHKTNLIE